MDAAILQRKNKYQFNRFNSIISQYQTKLDNRVSQVVQQIIGHTKKLIDPPLQPIVPKKYQEPARKKQQKDRVKSVSYQTDVSFLMDTTLDAQMREFRGTYKKLQSAKTFAQAQGRAVGSYSAVKPKFHKRKIDILPRQVRNNPFHQRNAIKAYELEKGMYSLIEKGRIGKDVNIITAFQKGNPILNTQKAIFHQGQERFAELQGMVNELASAKPQQVRQQKGQKKAERNVQIREKQFEDSWALTMPKNQEPSSAFTVLYPQKSNIILGFQQNSYIKMRHYETVKDQNYASVMKKNHLIKSDLIQLLSQLGKAMAVYGIQIAYANVSKLLNYITQIKRPGQKELLECLVQKDNKNWRSIANIGIQQKKRQMALDKIVSSLKLVLNHKKFKSYMLKKSKANYIYGWAVSCWQLRKNRQKIKQQRIRIQQNYRNQQAEFNQTFNNLQNEKHYQIHIVNENITGKRSYREIMNIQLTRIFNLRNVNKHIIYLLSSQLQEQTIHYYQKIMELEEIPNYKQRVTFIQVDPKNIFQQRFNLSTTLYYSTQTLQKIKRKVKNSIAYFVISYPSQIDIKLSQFMQIPIKGGNLLDLLSLEKRSNLYLFNTQTIDKLTIGQQLSNITALSDYITQYCHSGKKRDKFIIKINGFHRSHGSALLSAPFNSLPQMYSNTTLIIQGKTVDQYYHLLLKKGGVIQKYQQELGVITVILNIQTQGDVNIIGSFQKISSGFVNIAYNFPQARVQHSRLAEKVRRVGAKLYQNGHYGDAQLTFLVDQMQQIYLQKVQCYLTHLGSSLIYYNFLSNGEVDQQGDYLAKIVETFQKEGGVQQENVTVQPRTFCYIPYILHFGFSDRQVNSFFQLCRMGGVSFDLQNKYGATFILLGSLRSSMGVITTAKDRKSSLKLILKSLQFILKQNSHNMSNQTLSQKEVRMKERENIINLKERLEDA